MRPGSTISLGLLDLVHLHNDPYSSSLATSASVSSTSVWSDASSQSSDGTSISAPNSDTDSCDSYGHSAQQIPLQTSSSAAKHAVWAATQNQPQVEAPPDLRQNPRRTSTSSVSRSGCPPALVRQSDRKVNFVDNLVDSSTQIVEAVWPTSSVVCRNENANSGVLPLRTFIQETLRRSRTSYSTLQVALYYLVLIKPHVPTVDFTMEQPDDCHASRALQCGRRMFLAALILASKYLQDRNYSARAWSKISGLNTLEINQNEMAFVTAVDWKLHITDEVYNRWTDCVMKHTPSQPPSPGGCVQQRVFERQCEDFKKIILNVTPDLDNLDEILPRSPPKPRARQLLSDSYWSLYRPTQERNSAGPVSDFTPTQKSYSTPAVMEPNPASTHAPGRLAPALGLLPTPRMTPQASGLSTPAASATSYLLGKTPAMSLAMGRLNNTAAAKCLERWAPPTPSPQSHFASIATRRSSLANSVSTASSPESMVSDSSGASRSASISSASSLASAPSTKLDVQARCRYAKQYSERMGTGPAIASVPEDYDESATEYPITSSPDSYTGTVGKDLHNLSIDNPLAQQERDMDDAARALQQLHNYQDDVVYHALAPVYDTLAPVRAGSKRSRTVSIDGALQDNVREMLAGRYSAGEAPWPDTLVRPRSCAAEQPAQVPIRATRQDARKRVCCSTEAAGRFPMSSLHPAAMHGFEGPGMWAGIHN